MNKKKENPLDILATFTRMMASSGGYSILGEMVKEVIEPAPPYEKLGNGYDLRPIELKDKKGNTVDNSSRYSHLYHNGLKISSEIFRKGGLNSGFRDGYCSLIKYVPEKNGSRGSRGFSFGTHVIIDHLGEIVLKEASSSDCPYHIAGNLASIGNYIYDLRTGKAIAPKSSSYMKGNNFIILEHRYDWYNKEVTLPLGIYRIDLVSAEIIKIDDIK